MHAVSHKANAGCLKSSHSARKGVVALALPDNQLLKKPELKAEKEQKLFQQSPSPDGIASPLPSATLNGRPTLEYQRQRAKEMRQYFVQQRNEELRGKSQVFGWTPKNEISNGRWVMFGLLVGMLTEYATGVDFINQLKLMISYLGIVDLD